MTVMHIGILQFSLAIRWAASLKDKRSVIKSLKDRLRRRHNVSVAEIDNQDEIQLATLGIAMAGSDSRYLNGALDKIVTLLENHPEGELVDHQIEVL